MKIGAKIIGIGGVARAGKDTFAKLIMENENFRGKTCRTLAMADRLKENAEKFLKEYCGIQDIMKVTGEQKTDIRPFLVWYGCYMRKIDPSFWVNIVAGKINRDNESDVFIVTDVRFENEAKWVKDVGGQLVHVSRFQPAPYQTSIVQPANDEEKRNDPKVLGLADILVRWPTVNDENIASLKSYIDKAVENFN